MLVLEHKDDHRGGRKTEPQKNRAAMQSKYANHCNISIAYRTIQAERGFDLAALTVLAVAEFDNFFVAFGIHLVRVFGEGG